MTLALVDYGAGNLRSVENALRAAGAGDVTVTAHAGDVLTAERVVLPGVGAFAASMSALAVLPGMVEALNRRVLWDRVPFLGICVGMQLMADAGEEFGRHPGLGWVPGTVARLEPADEAARVPHMGWNDVTVARPHPVIEAGEAYFLHSFAFRAKETGDLAATTDHGGTVTAAVARDNMVGVQFHPEKSQTYGLGLLRRFLAWRP